MHTFAAALLLALTAHTVPFTLDHLQLDLNVDYENGTVGGIARLTIHNTSKAPVSDVPLLLGRLMTVKNAGGLQFDQDVLTFTDDPRMQVDGAVVHLREPLPPAATTTLSIEYGGPLVGYTETGSLYIKDHVDEKFSILREDAFAFPVLGALSHMAVRTLTRSFTYDVRVTVPSGFVVAAGAFAGQEEKDGKTTFHFVTAERVPFVNLAIAKFKLSDENGVRIYALPEDEAGSKMVRRKTEQALALLTNWLGPLARPPHVTIIEIPTGWGSQADLLAGIILTGETFQDPKWLFELYHELGHLWNPTELDRPSPRLNEGLSTWLEAEMTQELDASPSSHGKGTIDRLLKRSAKEPRLSTVPLASYGTERMGDWSYPVGAVYFHLLQAVIGRDALLGVLREWYQTHKTSGATLRDFTTLLESRYPRAKKIDDDWITSAAWLPKLRESPSVEQLAAKY